MGSSWFWIVEDTDYLLSGLEPGEGLPFGTDTVGIVDEREGGITLYVHKDKADAYVNMLNEAAD